MASVRKRLASHSFLQTGITDRDPNMIAHYIIARAIVRSCQVLRSHGKTNCICNSLSKRARSELNALMLDLWMPWTQRIRSVRVVRKQLFPSHSPVAGEIVVAILEQASMSVRQKEPISVEPTWLERSILHRIFPKGHAQSRHTDCRSRMSHVELLAEVRYKEAEALED